MFYSKELLARKTPLGQIWMAGTKGGKISRRNLSKINIEKVCEEIMNPPAPMSLRLQGILMNGAVIVHDKKVKLLQDDLNRLVAEINDSRKFRPDVSRIRKRKSAEAKCESVAFPSNADEDVAGPSYVPMGLDEVPDTYLAKNAEEELDSHQADPDGIRIPDGYFEPNAATGFGDERFDDGGEGDDEVDFTCEEEHMTHEPEEEERHDKAEEEEEQLLPDRDAAAAVKAKGAKKRVKKEKTVVMDDEETIIPGDVYQSWLEDPSDLCRKNRKRSRNRFSAKKMMFFTGVPSVAVGEGLADFANQTVYYPPELLELWRRDSYSSSFAPPPTPESQTAPEDVFMPPPGGSSSSKSNLPDVDPSISPTPVRMRNSDISGRPINIRIDLEPAEEEEEDNLFQNPEGREPSFELDGFMPDPVGTPIQASDDLQADDISEFLKSHLKTRFDDPGTSEEETLNHLTSGMSRKQAASLFYHTCVLATEDYIKVEQVAPYDDIVISRGPKL